MDGNYHRNSTVRNSELYACPMTSTGLKITFRHKSNEEMEMINGA